MKQTSRAVALLLMLESTKAGNTDVAIVATKQFQSSVYLSQFNLIAGGSNNSLNGGLMSRTAPYNWCPTWDGTATTACATANTTGMAALLPMKSFLSCTGAGASLQCTRANSTSQTVSQTNSTCVECIQNLGVWCSSTFAYNITTGNVIQTNSTDIKDQSVLPVWTGLLDSGSCCATIALFTPLVTSVVGAIAPATAYTSAGANGSNNCFFTAWSCRAFSNGQTAGTSSANSFAVPAFNVQSVTKQSWWCSNGLYNYVTATASSGTSVSNTKQILGDSENQRQELALVGCPQLQLNCNANTPSSGAASGLPVTNLGAVEVAGANQYNANVGVLMTQLHKCTWVAYAVKGAPVFTIADGNAGTQTSITKPLNATSPWILHHMEYNDSQLTIQAASDTYQLASNIDLTSRVPQFFMGSDIYSKQRTWYGKGYASGVYNIYNQSNWYTPYRNGAADGVNTVKAMQQWGYVAGFASSVAGTDYTGAGATAVFDTRQVRYFPVQLAINDNAMGVGVAAAYTTAYNTYTSAKTLWDNYVAILTKNSKVDAFAAAFSPPKAPTVPPLPNKPWMPNVAATMSKASAGVTTAGIVTAAGAAITVASQPTTQTFWINGEKASLATGGGWGSFTAASLRYRNGWGKSYGTIGYELMTQTGAKTKSAVYNQQWQCSATSPAGTATSACPQKYNGATSAAAGTATNWTTNTVTFYTAVSLWSEGKGAAAAPFATTGTTASLFQITWELGTWNDVINKLAAPASLTAATAATTLSGIVGAQALAASAAAAFGVAAALY